MFLQKLNIEEYLKSPLTHDCLSSHDVTADLNIIENKLLHKVVSHGPIFREPQLCKLKHYFKIIMDAVEDYARSSGRKEPRTIIRGNVKLETYN